MPVGAAAGMCHLVVPVLAFSSHTHDASTPSGPSHVLSPPCGPTAPAVAGAVAAARLLTRRGIQWCCPPQPLSISAANAKIRPRRRIPSGTPPTSAHRRVGSRYAAKPARPGMRPVSSPAGLAQPTSRHDRQDPGAEGVARPEFADGALARVPLFTDAEAGLGQDDQGWEPDVHCD